MVYIDHRLKKTFIKNKGYGFVAKDDIKAGEVLIKETPSVKINDDVVYSETFQLLYTVLTNKKIKEQFQTLVPNTIDSINIDSSQIISELKRVIAKNNTIYEFFAKNYTMNDIMVYCAKYMCNAFEFQGKPVILFTGTILNHSCLPNVIFGEKDNQMCFIAVRDIQKGEEICDNYIDITMPTNKRKKELKEQYGFVCNCPRCSIQDQSIIKKYDKIALEIEKERKTEFGYSKSKCV